MGEARARPCQDSQPSVDPQYGFVEPPRSGGKRAGPRGRATMEAAGDPDERPIAIDLTAGKDDVVIRIADRGGGFPRDLLPRPRHRPPHTPKV